VGQARTCLSYFLGNKHAILYKNKKTNKNKQQKLLSHLHWKSVSFRQFEVASGIAPTKRVGSEA
jgi:hypothetical protein